MYGKLSRTCSTLAGSDQTEKLYSPYGVFGPLDGPDVVYKKYNKAEVTFKKKMFADSASRVSKINAYIEKKQWEEVRAELQRQVYNMRETMNYLAKASGNKAAAPAARAFYQSMEDVNLFSKRKNKGAALSAYAEMMTALNTYSALI